MVGHASELESSFSQLQAYLKQAHCAMISCNSYG